MEAERSWGPRCQGVAVAGTCRVRGWPWGGTSSTGGKTCCRRVQGWREAAGAISDGWLREMGRTSAFSRTRKPMGGPGSTPAWAPEPSLESEPPEGQQVQAEVGSWWPGPEFRMQALLCPHVAEAPAQGVL